MRFVIWAQNINVIQIFKKYSRKTSVYVTALISACSITYNIFSVVFYYRNLAIQNNNDIEDFKKRFEEMNRRMTHMEASTIEIHDVIQNGDTQKLMRSEQELQNKKIFDIWEQVLKNKIAIDQLMKLKKKN